MLIPSLHLTYGKPPQEQHPTPPANLLPFKELAAPISASRPPTHWLFMASPYSCCLFIGLLFFCPFLAAVRLPTTLGRSHQTPKSPLSVRPFWSKFFGQDNHSISSAFRLNSTFIKPFSSSERTVFNVAAYGYIDKTTKWKITRLCKQGRRFANQVVFIA